MKISLITHLVHLEGVTKLSQALGKIASIADAASSLYWKVSTTSLLEFTFPH